MNLLLNKYVLTWFFQTENDITLDIAKRLTDEEIKEMIPSVGKRKIFTEAILATQEESYIAVCHFCYKNSHDKKTD